MTEVQGREVLGILGGMGPLSSAEFLRTIYECTLGEREQDSPAVVMLSDPAFPDRTTAFLAGEEDAVLGPLVAALQRLRDAGATRTVMCCMTVHHLLPRVPRELRERVVSLPRLAAELLLEARGRHLLVCSSGTRAFRLLEREPLWERVRDRVVLAEPEDQAAIHRDLIYPMKRPCDMDAQAALLERMLDRYGADGFVVGCSEVHILAKHLRGPAWREWSCVDPFRRIAEGLAAPSAAPALAAPL
ncbi:MAG TPA: aspartate/glutamate racemase family protein [Longimicrobiaceae bacterium]|jgi:aspartate racemase